MSETLYDFRNFDLVKVRMAKLTLFCKIHSLLTKRVRMIFFLTFLWNSLVLGDFFNKKEECPPFCGGVFCLPSTVMRHIGLVRAPPAARHVFAMTIGLPLPYWSPRKSCFTASHTTTCFFFIAPWD